jgi:excisionase family DNA binding protein
MKEAMDLTDLKTLEEATCWLKVKKPWFYQRICSGSLPFPYVKVGNHLRFPAEGIRRWLESQTRDGAA